MQEDQIAERIKNNRRLSVMVNSKEDFGRNKWKGRVQMANELLKAQRESLGTDHVTVASTLHHLGIALTHLGESYEYNAYTAFLEALWIRQKMLGPGHEDVAATTHHMWILQRKTYERHESYEPEEERHKEAERQYGFQ